MKELIIGRASDALASNTKGWVVGHFGEGIARSSEFEIKIWHYDEPPDYGLKTFCGTEFIIVESGILQIELFWRRGDGLVGQQTVVLNGMSRDYVVIPPGRTKRVFVMSAPAYGITVRWPSRPDLNKVVS